MSKRRLDIDGGATKKQREDEGGIIPGKKMNPHSGEVWRGTQQEAQSYIVYC